MAFFDQPMKNISTTRVHFISSRYIYYIEAAVFCLPVHLLNFGQHLIAENKNDVLLDNTMSQLTSIVAD